MQTRNCQADADVHVKGIRTKKQYVFPPSGGGHKKILYKHWDSLFTESPPFLRNRDIVFIKDAFTLGSSLIILYHFH